MSKLDANLMEPNKFRGDKQAATNEREQARKGLLGNIFNRESIAARSPFSSREFEI